MSMMLNNHRQLKHLEQREKKSCLAADAGYILDWELLIAVGSLRF
jgi:hypothetical protein